MTGRDRTCDAPRFKRALYRAELRSRGLAEPESNRRWGYGRGWARTRSFLFVRQALFPIELLARRKWTGRESNPRTTAIVCRSYHYGAAALPNSQLSGPRIRDKDLNLGLHVQSVASCLLDDPGDTGPRRRGAHVGREVRRAAWHGRPCSVFIGTRCQPRSTTVSVHPPPGDRRSRRVNDRTRFSMPLAYPSTLDRRPPVAHVRDGRRPTWRSFGARASTRSGKRQAKAHAIA